MTPEDEKRRPWGVHVLRDMIGGTSAGAGLPDGRYVRAVPLPYYPMGLERFRVAWWVFIGRAHAVVWPKAGDLEAALDAEI